MAFCVRMLRRCARCVHLLGPQLQSLCQANHPHVQQLRHHTIIMERVYPLPPGKVGGLPDQSEVNELHKILRHVKIHSYPDEMQCILTDFVDGIGIRGDVVTVKRDIFHQELFPAGLAFYASPENVKQFEEERRVKGIERSENRLGVFARMTMKELGQMLLQIPMNENTQWTLSKEHVKVAFRLQEVELGEECISLPGEPVTTFKDLELDVKINNLESVKVKAVIVPTAQTFSTTK